MQYISYYNPCRGNDAQGDCYNLPFKYPTQLYLTFSY